MALRHSSLSPRTFRCIPGQRTDYFGGFPVSPLSCFAFRVFVARRNPLLDKLGSAFGHVPLCSSPRHPINHVTDHRLCLRIVKQIGSDRLTLHRVRSMFIESRLETDSSVWVEVLRQSPHEKTFNHVFDLSIRQSALCSWLSRHWRSPVKRLHGRDDRVGTSTQDFPAKICACSIR